ncbi:cellulose synthase operon protein YhjQ/BcsQ [Pseudonocardia sp. H11422]|uniref:nucleotide-binding protein n=1 Tax=Pseudonocardia sp. H11422 TaxID=2835866 RepID=UPI001BDBB65C|nr:cellulose synthase operon protein YhjQ/BcsQ [Pseudonocardia sp. H11422]
MATTDMFQQGWDEEGTPPAPPVQPRPKRANSTPPQPGTVHPIGGRPALRLEWPPSAEPDSHEAPDPADEAPVVEPQARAARDRSAPADQPYTDPDEASDDAEPAPAPRPEQQYRARPGRSIRSSSEVDERDHDSRYLAARDLNHDTLTRHRADVPRYGWRLALYRATGGLVNPGIGEAERARQQLRARVNRPLRAPYRVAVTSIKGGIGKTTLTACLGFAMADIRGDQVSVIDANPDAGTLADRLTGNTAATIRDLLRDIDKAETLTEVTSYMSLAGRLKVLASDQDPAVSEALTAQEYEKVTTLLSKFFNVVLTDSGTGISHPTMEPTLRMADTLVVVGSPTVDGASRAGHTLDWLESHGHGSKARNAVVVLNSDRSSRDVDGSRIAQHFRTRVRAVVPLPYDPHLAAGGRIEFDKLRTRTRDSLTEIAAHIADQFPDRHQG